MKKYGISYRIGGFIEVEAETAKEAMNKVDAMSNAELETRLDHSTLELELVDESEV